MAAALVLGTSAFGRVGSSPTWGTNFCRSGVMVATADSKSAAFGRGGSSPFFGTKLL